MITDLETPRITIKDFTFNRFTIKTTSNIEQTTSYRLYLSMFKNDNIIILTKEKTERKMNNYRLDYWKRQQLLTTEIIPIFHTFFLFFFFFFHPFYVSFHSLLRPFQSSSKVDFFFQNFIQRSITCICHFHQNATDIFYGIISSVPWSLWLPKEILCLSKPFTEVNTDILFHIFLIYTHMDPLEHTWLNKCP